MVALVLVRVALGSLYTEIWSRWTSSRKAQPTSETMIPIAAANTRSTTKFLLRSIADGSSAGDGSGPSAINRTYDGRTSRSTASDESRGLLTAVVIVFGGAWAHHHSSGLTCPSVSPLFSVVSPGRTSSQDLSTRLSTRRSSVVRHRDVVRGVDEAVQPADR